MPFHELWSLFSTFLAPFRHVMVLVPLQFHCAYVLVVLRIRAELILTSVHFSGYAMV